VASFIWALVILWLSLMSGNKLPRINIPNLDKAVHFTFYFILSLLMFYGWMKQDRFPLLHIRPFLFILCIAIAYGILIEIAQETFTTTRHFELLDVAANSVGATIGSLIGVKLFK
jgi:VanZ family protein